MIYHSYFLSKEVQGLSFVGFTREYGSCSSKHALDFRLFSIDYIIFSVLPMDLKKPLGNRSCQGE